MSKYHRGLSMSECSRNSQRTGTTNVMAGSETFLSQTNQILHVFSVEYIVETADYERIHVTSRAIANTVEEVMVLTRQAVSKSRDRRLIEFVGEPIVLGKDRSWLTGGKNAHKLGPRITNEVTYVSLGVCTPSA